MLEEIEKYQKSLVNYYKSQDMEVFFYERNIPTKYGNEHFHLQVVPIPRASADNARKVLEYEGKRCGVQEWLVTDSFFSMRQVAKEEPFFAIQFPSDGKVYYTTHTENISIQFGRKVFAFVLNMLNRLDWKTCVLPDNQETKIAESFRKKFSTFTIDPKVVNNQKKEADHTEKKEEN